MQWRPPEKTSPLGVYTEELSHQSLFRLLSPIPLSSWNLSHPLHLISISTLGLHPCPHHHSTEAPHFLPGPVSQAQSPTAYGGRCSSQSEIPTPQHDGPGPLWLSPCLQFRPYLPLICSPYFLLVASKTSPLCLGRLKFFERGKKEKRWMGILSNAPYWVIFIFPCFWALSLL